MTLSVEEFNPQQFEEMADHFVENEKGETEAPKA